MEFFTLNENSLLVSWNVELNSSLTRLISSYKTEILSFSGSFHGRTIGSLAAGGPDKLSTFNTNVNDLIDGKIVLKYEAYFPEEIKQNKVDEYLIFVATEKKVPWLNEYVQIENLKKQFSKNKYLMEKHYSGYMLVK